MNICEQANKDIDIEHNKKMEEMEKAILDKIGEEYEKFITHGYGYQIIIPTCWDDRQIEFYSYGTIDSIKWQTRCTVCSCAWSSRYYERKLNDASKTDILEDITRHRLCANCEERKNTPKKSRWHRFLAYFGWY